MTTKSFCPTESQSENTQRLSSSLQIDTLMAVFCFKRFTRTIYRSSHHKQQLHCHAVVFCTVVYARQVINYETACIKGDAGRQYFGRQIPYSTQFSFCSQDPIIKQNLWWIPNEFWSSHGCVIFLCVRIFCIFNKVEQSKYFVIHIEAEPNFFLGPVHQKLKLLQMYGWIRHECAAVHPFKKQL